MTTRLSAVGEAQRNLEAALDRLASVRNWVRACRNRLNLELKRAGLAYSTPSAAIRKALQDKGEITCVDAAVYYEGNHKYLAHALCVLVTRGKLVRVRRGVYARPAKGEAA